ncbi:poly [ADP-ribose] polymerase [Dorcoceras hygrometricum]|uniref:Poly [ADP-ribose] polymerase n=1 Tax=Dorcoceras hygrometricum TaxID=472368 RepID=A0A2Z7B864_9LAMI|nr:poly [ADP-ribose] polymerase [Dorcoceras hygrometricum]
MSKLYCLCMYYKVRDTRSHSVDEDKKVTRKQKAEGKAPEAEQSPKKAKAESEHNNDNGKSTEDIKEDFKNFCKSTSEHLSIKQMREILEENGQDPSGSDDAVVPRWERGIPVVREAWLSDSIEKKEPQPLGAYDVVSDLVVGGGGIPLDKQDASEEALETITAEDDGVEVRHGGLGLRQLGIAAAHSKLEPKVAYIMKILCGQEIYRYALMEIGLDVPDLPIGMLTDLHLKRCEDAILEFLRKLKQHHETGMKGEAMWSDFSQRMFTLMPSTRPFTFRDSSDLADHVVSTFETVRDINAASRIIGDMSGSTLDDPLFEVYKKLRCSISPVEKEDHDYKMIAKYLEKTYEPVKVGEISYGVSIENVFAVELSAGPSLEEMKKLPNKVLLWCGFFQESASLEEKKHGVIGRGRKKTDESEHVVWKDDIRVPCGRLIPSEYKDSLLEYNEYAVYDPQQVSIRFLVAVKFEEKDVVYDVDEE